MHTLNIQLHTPILFIDYQHVRYLVYAVYAKSNKKVFLAPIIHVLAERWRMFKES